MQNKDLPNFWKFLLPYKNSLLSNTITVLCHSGRTFLSGLVHGLDATSGTAVAALLFDIFDLDAQNEKRQQQQLQRVIAGAPLRVLDMCCAPGLKLCMMADLSPPSSILMGVDVSSQRIALCKNIIKKYHIDSITSSSMSLSLELMKNVNANLE